MQTTSVVNVTKPEQGKHTVYIGRPGPGGAWQTRYNTGKPMGWGNPYRLGDKPGEYSREESLRLYRQDILSNPTMLERIRDELQGEVLGCFCKPEGCHGDILAELANMSMEQPKAYQTLIDKARTNQKERGSRSNY
jgi:hypothetical protein